MVTLPKIWNYDKEYDKKDPFAFIFPLDKKKKYNLKKDKRAIHTKNYIIYFGNADFCLGEKFLTNSSDGVIMEEIILKLI